MATGLIHIPVGEGEVPPLDPALLAAWYRDNPRALRNNMIRKWRGLGGAKSPLGLPLDPAFPVRQVENDAEIAFRGGNLKMSGANPSVEMSDVRHVVVTFEGMGLEIRQERGDEIYGQMVVQIGSTGFKQEFVIPEVTLGPESNNRIAQFSMRLYEGPPVDLNVVLSLVEHDSGDREAVRKEVREKVRAVFSEAENLAAGGSLGPAGTSVATSLRSESLASTSLKNWLIGGVGDLVNEVLGMGDDAYNPIGFTIYAPEMMTIAPLRQYRCWSDPRVIDHTHARITTCRDDAGDIGQIATLFSVRPKG